MNLFIKFFIIVLKITIFYISFIFIYHINDVKKNSLINKEKIKVCICTIGKEENRYIREFVSFYKKLGVDKIFLYDNNDIEKEHFEDVIKNYIEEGFVKLINWRGIERAQFKAINNCYLTYNKEYDWLIFYDIDEFIHLENYSNIKNYLSETKFNNCKKIYLNWVFHTDNNLIRYSNIPLQKRFPEIERDALINKSYSQKVKSIIRGNISNFKIAGHCHTSHVITDVVKACNGFGKKVELDKDYYMNNADTKYYYIDHFYTKSAEEFVNKINRGSAVNGNSGFFQFFRIIRFFYINQFNNDKLDYILKNMKFKFKFDTKK
jgi:hypothetical protein